MKKSHKIILVIIVVILLLLAFFEVYKYGTSKTKILDPEIGAVEVQDVDSVTKIDQESKSIKTQAKPKTASVTTNTTTSNSNLTQQIRVSVTAEERANCVKWQTAHGYVADGLCHYDKPYTQEYINQTQNPPEENTQTYNSSMFDFSFEYPAKYICGEYSGGGFKGMLDLRPQSGRDFIYKEFNIRCGNESIDGSVANSNGGAIGIVDDNGSSIVRTQFRQKATEMNSVMIGSNKFYYYWGGPSYLLILEKSKYLVIVSSTANTLYTSPNMLNLASLKFN